jgi:hypothetical protein
VDLQKGWSDQTVNGSGVSNKNAISGRRVPVYACPTDPRSDTLRNSNNKIDSLTPVDANDIWLYSTCYTFNFGTWFVFDPATGDGGDGLFFPNARLSLDTITDGTSNTLMASEVRAWQSYTRTAPNAAGVPLTPPSNPGEIQALAAATVDSSKARLIQQATEHTEWANGHTHHSGFTTTFRPNTIVPYTFTDGVTYNIDYTSAQDGTSATIPTCAAITSRSHHPGLVNSLLADGAVRTFSSQIDQSVWRALGTRESKEPLSASDF